MVLCSYFFIFYSRCKYLNSSITFELRLTFLEWNSKTNWQPNTRWNFCRQQVCFHYRTLFYLTQFSRCYCFPNLPGRCTLGLWLLVSRMAFQEQSPIIWTVHVQSAWQVVLYTFFPSICFWTLFYPGFSKSVPCTAEVGNVQLTGCIRPAKSLGLDLPRQPQVWLEIQ